MVAVQLDYGRSAGPALRAVPSVVALVHPALRVRLRDVRVVGLLIRTLEQTRTQNLVPELNVFLIFYRARTDKYFASPKPTKHLISR